MPAKNRKEREVCPPERRGLELAAIKNRHEKDAKMAAYVHCSDHCRTFRHGFHARQEVEGKRFGIKRIEDERRRANAVKFRTDGNLWMDEYFIIRYGSDNINANFSN